MRSQNSNHSYEEVVTRTLRSTEQRAFTDEQHTPLVIEPLRSRSTEFLENFLSSHSRQIVDDVATYGAVLVRGFEVHSTADFERQILSIRGMQGMNEVLMSEPGRTVVDGTRFVLHTNALMKTGGTLGFGGFHTENYYGADVPRFISFYCQLPSRLGGETGLINTAKLYADLPEHLKAKLEERAFWASATPISDMLKRYSVSAAQLEHFCAEAGLPIETHDDRKFMFLYKPSVIIHPLTQERALAINISGEVNGRQLHCVLHGLFRADYSGLLWTVHKLYWRCLSILNGRENFTYKLAVRIWSAARQIFSRRSNTRVVDAKVQFVPPSRVGNVFTKEDIQILAESMRRHYSSFFWKRGDILVVDNLKMAHGGMPGFGRRQIRALICNRIPLRFSHDASGAYLPPIDETYECLGNRLATLAR